MFKHSGLKIQKHTKNITIIVGGWLVIDVYVIPWASKSATLTLILLSF